MKKSLIKFSIFYFLLSSCTAIKQLSNQKIVSKENSNDFNFDNSQCILNITVDNKKTSFLFDTGASGSVILDTSIVKDFYKKKIGSFGSYKGADKVSKKSRFITVKVNSDLFDSENKAMLIIDNQKKRCSKKPPYNGILGLDPFFENNLSLILDFTNNKIANINNTRLQELIKNKEYHLIKSQCKLDQIFIFLVIEGVEYKFKLDSGFTGSIIIPYSDKINLSKYNLLTLEGATYSTINSITKGEENYYENVPVSIGNTIVNTKINISHTIKAQNIGMQFIKGFDWIIDYNNNEVYIKQNNNKIENMFNKNVFQYSASEKNDKLIVTTKQKQLTQYNLGDQIISINNTNVTPENICEMQELLNKTQDWNTLHLEVIPVKP